LFRCKPGAPGSPSEPGSWVSSCSLFNRQRFDQVSLLSRHSPLLFSRSIPNPPPFPGNFSLVSQEYSVLDGVRPNQRSRSGRLGGRPLPFLHFLSGTFPPPPGNIKTATYKPAGKREHGRGRFHRPATPQSSNRSHTRQRQPHPTHLLSCKPMKNRP